MHTTSDLLCRPGHARGRPLLSWERFRVGDQGASPMWLESCRHIFVSMSSFMLLHSHEPDECPSAYAAWKGFESPLRGQQAVSSCRNGGHAIWWEVMADDGADALALLPVFVRERTVAARVTKVDIP